MLTPRATLRLQFHTGFTFDDARRLVPHFAALGVSHIYASPLLTARPGSPHGYDVVDVREVNATLGGEAGLRRLVATLREYGMGLIADFVPNHMGIGRDNAWWNDVLAFGRDSPYAAFFDIDWNSPDPSLRGKVLLPVLGASYGETLKGGQLLLDIDPSAGGIFARYHDHRFPIAPRDYPAILEMGGVEGLANLARGFGRAHATPNALARAAAIKEARRALAQMADSRDAHASLRHAFDPANPAGRDRLHHLLERQHYRLAWWRTAADEINWRRFFDINELAGIRVERPPVFEAVHAIILRLYAEGLIDGLRIDHVDGLADPRGYCRKLRRRLDLLSRQRPADAPNDAIIVVEKILAEDERLPADWLADGTTGYDFMAEVAGLLHDPAGEAPLTRLWHRIAGQGTNFGDEVRRARRSILAWSFASEFEACAASLHRIARHDPETRDVTLHAIRRALAELIVAFPVYRTYAGSNGRPADETTVFADAVTKAAGRLLPVDRPVVKLLDRWLGGEAPSQLRDGRARRDRLAAIRRFQQLTPPVAAKAVEDTAFYRYGRLLSLNEVGADPGRFSVSPEAFHAACLERLRTFPRAMLATATHDHKRGADLRARLAVLSEIPDVWSAAVQRWTIDHAPLRTSIDGTAAPDAADEYMLYQMLVGAWPPELAPGNGEAMSAFQERLADWQVKALREAKRHSSWAAPDSRYEAACRTFLARILDPAANKRPLSDITALVERIAVPGAINGLTQTLLQLTVPGIPDLYQGAEFWDFSLVDPDNRRPVDFRRRETTLGRGEPLERLLAEWRNGEVKQALIARALAARASKPNLFARGDYVPLDVRGAQAEHVLAFARLHGDDAALVLATRLPGGLPVNDDIPSVPPSCWQDTAVVVPRELAHRTVDDVLSERSHALAGRLPVAEALASLPLCLLIA